MNAPEQLLASVTTENELPILTKIYFTITEVSQLCGLKQYVLRYWEQEFPMLQPIRRKNRRYYRHKDIFIIQQIKDLLYSQYYTIKGARLVLAKKRLMSARGIVC